MSTLVTIAAGDLITNSRADINTNFSNLNTDKIETSVLDTDTALAANSDAKIATQKAVKAYMDGVGTATATTTVKGAVEIATQAEVDAGTATGGTGASLVVTPATLIATTPYIMGPLPPTTVKTFHTFKVPMIGTSAAAVQGAWLASSADVEFVADALTFSGTGADRATIATVFRKNGSTGYLWSDSNIIGIDVNAILAISTVDHAIGFGATDTYVYNQTAQPAIMFTTNNGNLYAHTCTGATSTSTQITGITLTTIHNYKIVADLGADTAYFYVDGVLKQTLTTNFPTTSAVIDALLGRNATANSYFSNPYFFIEMNP